MRGKWLWAARVTLALMLGALVIFMLHEAMEEPVVRSTYVGAPDWPKGTAPIRIVALSDIHAGPPDVMPRHLARVVAMANALKPDLVVISGDLISHKYLLSAKRRERELLAPLGALRAPLGIVAVPGNHEHKYGYNPVRRALPPNIDLLANRAVRKGPLLLLAVDDAVTGHEDLGRVEREAGGLSGVRVMVTHSPRLLDYMPAGVRLFLTGHTHCGQISLPWIGPVMGRYNAAVTCGEGRHRGAAVIVGAGIGTSGVPFRLNAPPDMWLVTIGPERHPR